MDSSNPRNQANDVANSAQSGETFVGSIRWIALAIGVACLALLTLVGGLAHAAANLGAAALPDGHDAMRAYLPALANRVPAQAAEMPVDAYASIERRDWTQPRKGARIGGAVGSPQG